MKTLILLLLPFIVRSQDTLPAILKVQQGNYTKYVKGKVVLKDCKVVGYLRVNTWRRKEKLFPMKGVVDYRLFNN